MAYCTKRLWAFIVILCTATGCSNRLPAEPLEKRLGYTSEMRIQYQVEESWWVIYKDEQLNGLISTALQNNLDYAQSAVRINRAMYQANSIGVDLLPKFTAVSETSSTQDIHSGTSERRFSSEFSVSYEVDLWRKLSDSAAAKKWEYEATVEDRAAAKLALINNVVDVYFSLAYLDMALKITRQNIANYEKILEIITAKYQYGKISGLEPEQAAQSLLAAKNNLIDFEVQQQSGLQNLRILLNLEPAAPLEIIYPDILSVQVPEVNLDIPLAVLANRPDLKAAQYRLQSAFKNVQAAQKAWFPQITLGAAIGSESNSHNTMFDMPFVSSFAKITLPFLQWNMIKWNIKISEAEYDEVKLNLEKVLNSALNELNLAFFQYRKAEETYQNIFRKHEHDVRISQYYRVRYDSGASELSDWLNSLNTAAGSQLDMLKNRYLVIKYENVIYKSIAGRYTHDTN